MKWTKNVIEGMKNEFLSKKTSSKDMAKKYGVSPQNLRKVLQRHGLQWAAKFSRNIGRSSKLGNRTCAECGFGYSRSMIHERARLYICDFCINLTKVYYLPEEHYIGIANNIKSRIRNHKSSGKITEGWIIVAKFERRVDAHLMETMFHVRGYQGFRNLIKNK